ncbi:MAG: AAA family ATPase [Deltaproteobacteria bacterium]|nr:AAA family ATPase [Deltaproteobacteria bacterium]
MALSPRQQQAFVRSVELVRDKVASFDRYPFNIPAVRHLSALELHPGVTFLVGENGSGKSTLIEAIAVAMGFNAEGGSQNFRFGTRASHSDLHQALRIVRGLKRPKRGFFLRAESLFNVATEIERLGPQVSAGYGDRSLHEQSHGESFLAIVNNRFHADGFYVLDEPEAALSPQRQLALLVAIHGLVQARCQFVIATHSPLLLAYPGAQLYLLGAEGLTQTTYEETEHYSLTRDFLMDPKRYLARLLAD